MFDLAEVRIFVANLEDRMNRCDNGEGMECANLDDSLRHYAILSCEYREEVRQWGRAVFAGRVAFDPEVERLWQDEGHRLYFRAMEMLGYGAKAEASCYVLDGRAALEAALWNMHQLLVGWVTPSRAVGPSARQGLALAPESAAEARRKIDSLPPLPSDWQPLDPRQQNQLRKLRRRDS